MFVQLNFFETCIYGSNIVYYMNFTDFGSFSVGKKKTFQLPYFQQLFMIAVLHADKLNLSKYDSLSDSCIATVNR